MFYHSVKRAVSFLVPFAAFLSFQSAQARSWEEIKTTKTLIVAYAGNVPPFQYRLNPASEPVGFELELVRMIAKDLDLTLILKEENTYEKLYTKVASGEYDLSAGTLSLVSTRKDVNLSRPYGCLSAAFITSDPALKKLSDLKNKKLGVATGSVYESYAKKYVPHDRIVSLPTPEDNLKALTTNKVDAVIGWKPTIPFVNKVYKLDLKDTPTLWTIPAGFLIDPQAPALKTFVDRSLISYKKTGKINELAKRFGMADGVSCE